MLAGCFVRFRSVGGRVFGVRLFVRMIIVGGLYAPCHSCVAIPFPRDHLYHSGLACVFGAIGSCSDRLCVYRNALVFICSFLPFWVVVW